jgi:hypothetical protein
LLIPNYTGLGSVWLEIRRIQGTPVEHDVSDPEDSEGRTVMCEVDMDLLDDPVDNKPPWVVLKFDFKKPISAPNSSRRSSINSSEDAGKISFTTRYHMANRWLP